MEVAGSNPVGHPCVRWFPALSAILVEREGGAWLAMPPRGDSRFQTQGRFCIHLVAGADLFDTVRVRFDGSSFWFDRLDPHCDAGAGAFLRQALARMADPASLSRPGLAAQQVAAYGLVYAERNRGDVGFYRAMDEAQGARHAGTARPDDMTAQSAGICLSGDSEQFDLQSLVGVVRETREQLRAQGNCKCYRPDADKLEG